MMKTITKTAFWMVVLPLLFLSHPVKAESLLTTSATHPQPPSMTESDSEAVADTSSSEEAAQVIPAVEIANEPALETAENADAQEEISLDQPKEKEPVADETSSEEKEKSEKKYTDVAFDIGLFPSASINEAFDGPIRNNVSLGIFGTKQDKLKGFGASLFFNRQDDEMLGMTASYGLNLSLRRTKGFQAAMLMNYSGDDMDGFQAAALYNHVGGRSRGVQASAIANVTVGDFSGAQLATISSVTAGNFKGLQLSIASVAVGETKGVQAGLGTYSKNVEGGQLGLLNLQNGESLKGFQWGLVDLSISETSYGPQFGLFNLTTGSHKGVQAGLLNVATSKVKGAQIGLFNYAEEADAPIGLISIVKNGMLHGNFWTSDTALINAGLKFGGKYVYNIVSAGIQPTADSFTMSLGWGIGGHAPIHEKWFIDSDLMFHRQSRMSDFNDFAMVNKLRVMAGWQLSDDVALLFGPTLNVIITEAKNIDAGDVSFISDLKTERFDNNRRAVSVMPGFMAGIQI